jgi:hypothetical protein
MASLAAQSNRHILSSISISKYFAVTLERKAAERVLTRISSSPKPRAIVLLPIAPLATAPFSVMGHQDTTACTRDGDSAILRSAILMAQNGRFREA